MKKRWIVVAVVALLVCAAVYVSTTRERTVPGTEQTYYGTVSDRAMSPVDVRDPFDRGRAYVGIKLDNGEGMLFWLAKESYPDVGIGDYVEIESAIEKGTDLLVATRITVVPQ